MLPNFIVLGAQKAGTTSLHEGLSQHPDIYSAPELKDRDYFSNPDRRDDPLTHIGPFLKGIKKESIVLHTHVNYLLYRQAIENIEKFCSKEVRLAVILRAPTDRAVSAYNYFKKLRRENRPLNEALDYTPGIIHDFSFENNDFTYLEHGLYARQLEVLYSAFPPEQILLLDFEEFRSNAAEVGNAICKFIEVDPSIVLDFKFRNVTGQVKSEAIQDILSTGWVRKKFQPVIDRFTTLDMRTRVKEQLSEWNTSKKKYKPEIPDEALRSKLERVFADDVRRLVEDFGFEAAREWPEFVANTSGG